MLERNSGVALWRQIADEIRAGLGNGLTDHDGQLPPEMDLAKRFQVNRHTVRAAIAVLTREKVLEARQGRGTFMIRHKRVTYPIRSRTRFSSGIGDQAQSRSSRLVASHQLEASAEIARRLHLQPGAPVLCLETVSQADSLALSLATHWFDALRFSAIETVIRDTGSVTAGLKACGVADYVRQETRIEARHANASEIDALDLSPGAIVLVTDYVNADLEGKPVECARTRFAADRVTLTVDAGASPPFDL